MIYCTPAIVTARDWILRGPDREVATLVQTTRVLELMVAVQEGVVEPEIDSKVTETELTEFWKPRPSMLIVAEPAAATVFVVVAVTLGKELNTNTGLELTPFVVTVPVTPPAVVPVVPGLQENEDPAPLAVTPDGVQAANEVWLALQAKVGWPQVLEVPLQRPNPLMVIAALTPGRVRLPGAVTEITGTMVAT